jgi:hypothetical protein
MCVTNHGFEIIPKPMRENSETGHKARQRRAMAFDQDMFARHSRDRSNWIHNKIIVICIEPGSVCSKLEGKKLDGEKGRVSHKNFRC